jgi:3-hydroxyisobutyrate dehydrogenase
LDAPVTGTKPHAASGELLFLVGGSPAALAAAQPVFSVLGRDLIHLGPVGSGTLMKLINNFVCGVEAACFAEAMALVEAGRLDPSQALSILNGGAPGSGILRRISERIVDNDFTPNFHLRWMAKDLSYALDSGLDRGIALEMAGPALALFERAVSQGRGDEDFSAIVKTVAVSMKP